MKKGIILLFMVAGVTTLCFAQAGTTWTNFDGLVGEWVGDGAGQPGQGSGTFTFSYDLGNKILVRKGHTTFPKTENKAETIHDDLMVVYAEYPGAPLKAVYFDNEGHTINYTIQCVEKSIILTSSKMPNVPIFRLTYTLLDKNVINTKFEMSRDGEKFNAYLEGKSKKVN